MSVNSATELTINANGAGATYGRRMIATEVGREYTITATGANNPVYFKAGTTAGGTDLYDLTILLVNMAGTTAGWTLTSGPGTVTPNVGAGTVLLSAAGSTPTVTRRLYTVVAGRQYRVRWNTSGTTCASSLSTTISGEQYKGLGSVHDPLGDNSFIFTATSTSLYWQFQRTALGDCTIGSIALEQID